MIIFHLFLFLFLWILFHPIKWFLLLSFPIPSICLILSSRLIVRYNLRRERLCLEFVIILILIFYLGWIYFKRFSLFLFFFLIKSPKLLFSNLIWIWILLYILSLRNLFLRYNLRFRMFGKISLFLGFNWIIFSILELRLLLFYFVHFLKDSIEFLVLIHEAIIK